MYMGLSSFFKNMFSGNVEADIVGEENKSRSDEYIARGREVDQPLNRYAAITPAVTRRLPITRKRSLDRMWSLIKESPEVYSLISSVVEDIIGDGVRFEYVGRTDVKGDRNIKESRRFWKRELCDEVVDFLYDFIGVGEGYLYERIVDEEEIKSKALDYVRENYSFNSSLAEVKAAEMTYENIQERMDEDPRMRVKGVEQVPASTVEKNIDEHGNVLQYVQRVGSNEFKMSPENVISMNNVNINGSIYGFAPAYALVTEMNILANAKEHHEQVFQNAGVVSKIYNIKEEGPNSTNYKTLKKTLKQFRKLENKHRDLIISGDVEVKDLNSIGEEMDFRQLAEYVTRVIVMTWGVPPSRVGVDVGAGQDRATSTSSALSHEGYFRKIKYNQKRLEAKLNEFLFEPFFGTNIKFVTSNIRKEMRKAEKTMKEVQVVKQLASLGLISKDAARKRLGISQNDLPRDLDIDDAEFVKRASNITGMDTKELGLSSNQVDGDDLVNELRQKEGEEQLEEQD